MEGASQSAGCVDVVHRIIKSFNLGEDGPQWWVSGSTAASGQSVDHPAASSESAAP